MATMAEVAVKSEDRVRLTLVLMVMDRIQCAIEFDETGLATCTKHCASVEDWDHTDVCLKAVTEAGLTGGE